MGSIGPPALDRCELSRLLQDALLRQGYPESAACLARESGVALLCPRAEALHAAVGRSDWAAALHALDKLVPPSAERAPATFLLLARLHRRGWALRRRRLQV